MLDDEAQHPKPLKYILYYNSYWGSDDFQFGEGEQPFRDYGCRVPYCYATSNRSTLESMSNYDAMLFHVHYTDLPSGNEVNMWNWRQPHQWFVMMSMESPLNDRRHYRKDYAGFFNATMTYRRDSDFPRPYGWFRRKPIDPRRQHRHKHHQQQLQKESQFEWSIPTKPNDSPRTWIPYDKDQFMKSLPKRNATFLALANRSKKVAWVVSNCKTSLFREDYVKELQEYIQVDIYGKCGTVPCDATYRAGMSGTCVAAIPRDYKFYLGFENAFCDDYVTEKFFQRVNDHVVIVLGQANYQEIAPPHSYINAMDFQSPQQLAKYLHALDQDPSKYLSYFWWKDYYEVVGPSRAFFAPAICRLCERLHQDTYMIRETYNKSHHIPSTTAVYQDMEQWWRGDAHCGQLMTAWKHKSPRIGAQIVPKRIGATITINNKNKMASLRNGKTSHRFDRMNKFGSKQMRLTNGTTIKQVSNQTDNKANQSGPIQIGSTTTTKLGLKRGAKRAALGPKGSKHGQDIRRKRRKEEKKRKSPKKEVLRRI